MKLGIKVLLILSVFFFMLNISSCGKEGFGGYLISDEREVEMGSDVSKELALEYKLVSTSDPVHEWAVQLVNGLSSASSDLRNPSRFGGYKVRVIKDDKLVNAFAAPGGFTYLSTGLILKADKCAEIAGVMSHELAHVIKRHSIKSLETKMSAQMLGELFGLGEIAQATLSVATGYLTGVTYSKDQEHEADKVAIGIMGAATYNPLALADFFAKLIPSGGESAPGMVNKLNDWFSSHPRTSDRISAVEKEVESKYPGTTRDGSNFHMDCVGTTMQLDAVKARISGSELQIEAGTGTKKKDNTTQPVEPSPEGEKIPA